MDYLQGQKLAFNCGHENIIKYGFILQKQRYKGTSIAILNENRIGVAGAPPPYLVLENSCMPTARKLM